LKAGSKVGTGVYGRVPWLIVFLVQGVKYEVSYAGGCCIESVREGWMDGREGGHNSTLRGARVCHARWRGDASHSTNSDVSMTSFFDPHLAISQRNPSYMTPIKLLEA
jgi:hypothetical protein